MKQRVKSDPYYSNVAICAAWKTFSGFYEDMGNCPAGYSLERIDNNGNYNKSNCKWIPKSEQAKNTKGCIRFVYQGRELILSDWCRELNLSYSTVRKRIKRGWSIVQALELEPRRRNAVTDHSMDEVRSA
jgi:hypothetical protein